MLLNLPVFIMFFVGLVLIVKGADWFVESAVWMADSTGIPKIVIGATIVSFATTLPELVVSSFASLDGHPGMAIGNAVGSTICNIGLILGTVSLIKPIHIERRSFTYKGFMMIVAWMLTFYFSKNHVISSLEGMILLIMSVFYVLINFIEIQGNKNNHYGIMVSKGNLINCILKFIIGAAGVFFGANLAVDNGVKIAYIIGVPERVISLTMIAMGTSMPELITSIAATIKGFQSISVGNILGANILNLLMVLGSAATINPLKISPQAIIFDFPISLIMMVLLMITGFSDRKIERWEGGILLSAYLLYLWILVIIFFD
ncbi:MAG: cation:H+ antiporter [Thermosediminibacterales bacterium]|nr:cation:H+ antiporter [Thermosediminibacterales bacterium]MDK2835495.1 cation:H+ antiporter [Thermosediminibacterales bacterium]